MPTPSPTLRLAPRRVQGRRARGVRLALLLTVAWWVGLVATTGCTPREAPRPDIVLVTFSGVRGVLGGADPGEAGVLLQAAGLDDATRFSWAYAQSPRATQGMASLLTGLYPAAIPICSPGGEAAAWCSEVPTARPMVQEVLGAYGYRTALFEEMRGANDKRTALMGIEDVVVPTRGFEHRRVVRLPRSSEDALDDLRAWWEAHRSQPRFLLYAGVLPSGDLATAENRTVEQEYARLVEEAGRFVRALDETLAPGSRPRLLVLTSLYGLNLDERSGAQADQLIMASHDHLLERVLHVPLAIDGAGPSPRAGTIVQLVDVLPTLLVAAGATLPATHHGRDLLVDAAPDPVAYAEYGDMVAMRGGDHLLMARCFEHGSSALSPRLTAMLAQDLDRLRRPPGEGAIKPLCATSLHDVVTDPLQTEDLLATGATTRELHLYERLVDTRTGPGAPALPDEAVGSQRRLGYW